MNALDPFQLFIAAPSVLAFALTEAIILSRRQRIESANPLRIKFTQWVHLLRDLAGARSLRAFLGYLFMPPGWTPHGEGSTTAELRARRSQAEMPQGVAGG